MNKIIDFVAVRTALFLLLVIWTVYFLKDVLYAVILSAILFTAVCFVLEKLKNRKNSKAYSMDKLDRQCALLGNKYVIQLYRDVTSPAAEIKGDRYFIEGSEMVYSAYKFSSCGLEDVSAAYRTAKENAVTRITMLVKDADRQAVMLAQSTGLNYTFIKSRKLYKKLKDMRGLPPLVFSRPGNTVSVKNFADIIFNKANLRYYLITGFMLSVMFFFVPLKGYYLTIGTISLVLALITAIRK